MAYVPALAIRPLRHGPLVAILALSVLLNLIGIWWGLPNAPEAWAADELTPLEVFEGGRRGFSHGWFSVYPPLHYYVLTLVQLPVFLAVWAGQATLTDLQTYTLLFLAMRATSVVMAAATVGLVYACGRVVGDEPGARYAALATALILPFVYYAKVANVDGPALFWYVLALWCYLRALRDDRLRDYLGLAAAAVGAVATKDQAIALFLVMPVVLAGARYRRARGARSPAPWRAALLDRRLVASALLAVGLLALVENVAFNWASVLERLHMLPGLPEGFEAVPPTPAGQLRLLGIGIRHLTFSLGWPLFLTCLAGLAWSLWRWREATGRLALLVPLVSYWVGLVMPIRYVFDRYLLPVAVTLTLFGGPVLHALARARRLRPAGALLVIGCLGYGLLAAASLDWLMIRDGRYVAEEWIAQHVPAGARVAVVGYRWYHPRFLQADPAYVTTPTVEEVRAVNAEYLVTTSLFDEDRFRGAPEVLTFFRRLKAGVLGYVPVYRYQTRLPWNPVSFQGVRTNLDKINPEIVIYKRVPHPIA